MKKLFAVLLFGLIVAAALPFGCSGADTVVGPPDPREGTPVPTPSNHPRPTPNPCRQNPADCD